jgi:hypothetical protein
MDPTADDIIAAFKRCKAVHGRCWRQTLRLAWCSGDYGPLDEVSGTLQWLRNSEHPLRRLPHGIV